MRKLCEGSFDGRVGIQNEEDRGNFWRVFVGIDLKMIKGLIRHNRI